MWENIQEKDLGFGLNEQVDFARLSELAIRYSDGLIQASSQIDEKVAAIAKASGKPFLAYQDSDTYVDAYNNFYDEVWEAAHK